MDPPLDQMSSVPAQVDAVTVESRHPTLWQAVLADAEITTRFRMEEWKVRSRAGAICQALRLMWVSDAFLAQCLYRVKTRFQVLGIPVLPRIAHRLAMISAQVCIGDPVVVQPGIYLAHGQVVIDGIVHVDAGAVIFPWVTIGLQAGNLQGPTIERDVHIGTGAKILGPVTIGAGAHIGANAVVVHDVRPASTVVGIPAREQRA